MSSFSDAPSWQDLLGPGWEKYADPRTYARFMANSQFNPVIRGLDMQRARQSMLAQQSNRRISEAMQPALQAYKDQFVQNSQLGGNAEAAIRSMAGQLAQGIGGSGNNAALGNTAANYGGLISAQAATQGRSDVQGLTQAQQRVSQMQANRQAELTNKMMDIDRAMVDAKRAKAEAYTKAFTEGLGLKQQLIASALANRGSMINQDVLQAMAPEQLKSAQLANKQAQQNLIWQDIQGRQGVEMNALQMKALKQQLAAAGANTNSFFSNSPENQSQVLNSFMGQYLDPNTGGWKSGFDAHKVVESMYRQMKTVYKGTGKKNPAKLRKAISDWVLSYNGIDPASSSYDPGTGGLIDPGIGGSYQGDQSWKTDGGVVLPG